MSKDDAEKHLQAALRELGELKAQFNITVVEREKAKEFGRIMENSYSALKLENEMLARVANEGNEFRGPVYRMYGYKFNERKLSCVFYGKTYRQTFQFFHCMKFKIFFRKIEKSETAGSTSRGGSELQRERQQEGRQLIWLLGHPWDHLQWRQMVQK